MKQLTSFLLLLSLTVTAQRKDWLIDNRGYTATVKVTGQQLTLTNGLLSRSFVLQPNAACTDYRNVSNGDQLLRAIQPEARVTLDGRTYNVGGLSGQRQKAYLLPEWLGQLQRGPDDFVYVSHLEKPLTAYVKTRQQPKGRELEFTYRHPGLAGITVKVHYELYDGIPALCKWLSIENRSGKTLMVNQVVNEILAATEEESAVVGGLKQMKVPHQLYVESNYAFNNAMKASLSDQTTHWNADSTYTSQVNYNLTTPCLLEVYADRGIHRALANDSVFTSIRTNELLLDSYDRERNGLAQRRLYRTIAPWTTRNPIFMHLVSTDPEKVRGIVDQCAATGYEGVILSFGSGLNMEDTAAANINKFKQLADYAHAKGILLGGYSLFSSRRISDEDDVIDPKTGKPGGAFFGHAPCLGSKWGMAYLQKIEYFIKTTGFDIFENDGPYPGDICASTTHPGHRGLDDSQWAQMELQKAFYRRISEAGVYINAPDWYFLDGTHKIALGYREVNFSLPRAEQLILNRQNIYDGTWEKTPAMGWGFVPLSQYQGGEQPLRSNPCMNTAICMKN
ncbi:alpha-galactosidase [Chitinophaga sedimenti]|uniref:alpha-galactosidase n=1 Tax=Chitinophaga sedimenti TaxID=2033606 RepID=UPI0020035D44|nr:alpha-galactosidase [Chitinophaga sedimenti]MCK7557450.1 alpha-galactosidase [Chitinophaga sedimenti]